MNNTAANVPVDLHVKGLLEMETSNNADRIPEITCDADAISVESTTLEGYGSSLSSSYSSSSLRLSNSRPYEGTPVIDRCTIIVLGFLVLGLALIWPPLLLLFAYWTSKFVSYAFRENDDAAVRRQLFAQFCQESSESLPDRFRNIDKFVLLEESYWTNERYVLEQTTERLTDFKNASENLTWQYSFFTTIMFISYDTAEWF